MTKDKTGFWNEPLSPNRVLLFLVIVTIVASVIGYGLGQILIWLF